MADYVTLDSGSRAEYASGMARDTQEGKPRYDLIPLWFLRELAELMARGAEKYGDRNWEQANSPEEVARMDGSGLRHHFQYLEGDRTENHLAATVFNLFAAEDTRRRIDNEKLAWVSIDSWEHAVRTVPVPNLDEEGHRHRASCHGPIGELQCDEEESN